jgi:hypothetical protein
MKKEEKIVKKKKEVVFADNVAEALGEEKEGPPPSDRQALDRYYKNRHGDKYLYMRGDPENTAKLLESSSGIDYLHRASITILNNLLASSSEDSPMTTDPELKNKIITLKKEVDGIKAGSLNKEEINKLLNKDTKWIEHVKSKVVDNDIEFAFRDDEKEFIKLLNENEKLINYLEDEATISYDNKKEGFIELLNNDIEYNNYIKKQATDLTDKNIEEFRLNKGAEAFKLMGIEAFKLKLAKAREEGINTGFAKSKKIEDEFLDAQKDLDRQKKIQNIIRTIPSNWGDLNDQEKAEIITDEEVCKKITSFYEDSDETKSIKSLAKSILNLEKKTGKKLYDPGERKVKIKEFVDAAIKASVYSNLYKIHKKQSELTADQDEYQQFETVRKAYEDFIINKENKKDKVVAQIKEYVNKVFEEKLEDSKEDYVNKVFKEKLEDLKANYLDEKDVSLDKIYDLQKGQEDNLEYLRNNLEYLKQVEQENLELQNKIKQEQNSAKTELERLAEINQIILDEVKKEEGFLNFEGLFKRMLDDKDLKKSEAVGLLEESYQKLFDHKFEEDTEYSKQREYFKGRLEGINSILQDDKNNELESLKKELKGLEFNQEVQENLGLQNETNQNDQNRSSSFEKQLSNSELSEEQRSNSEFSQQDLQQDFKKQDGHEAYETTDMEEFEKLQQGFKEWVEYDSFKAQQNDQDNNQNDELENGDGQVEIKKESSSNRSSSSEEQLSNSELSEEQRSNLEFSEEQRSDSQSSQQSLEDWVKIDVQDGYKYHGDGQNELENGGGQVKIKKTTFSQEFDDRAKALGKALGSIFLYPAMIVTSAADALLAIPRYFTGNNKQFSYTKSTFKTANKNIAKFFFSDNKKTNNNSQSSNAINTQQTQQEVNDFSKETSSELQTQQEVNDFSKETSSELQTQQISKKTLLKVSSYLKIVQDNGKKRSNSVDIKKGDGSHQQKKRSNSVDIKRNKNSLFRE